MASRRLAFFLFLLVLVDPEEKKRGKKTIPRRAAFVASLP
jgi:hypothetical protein